MAEMLTEERMSKHGKIPHVPMRDIVRIYDALNIGVIVVNGNGIVIWGNRYYSSLVQFDIREYYGKNVRVISQNEKIGLSTGRTLIDVISETKASRTEVVRYQTDDYIITRGTPILNERNEIDYIVYTMFNYSELMETQETLSRSTWQALALEAHLRSIQVDQNIGKDIVMSDKMMYEVYGKALRLAGTTVSVLLTGESGVGKDVLAKFIHQNSPRKDEKFIHVNLATIPKPLFESELFGYAPGSFTGASKHGKEGLIQLANNGTLFLDEIGELPLDIQSKLLQVIQDKRVRAVGAVDFTPVDFRIVSATNRDLKEMVKRHEFRLDLYYRLNAIELHIPPLRERHEDIPLLATHFLNLCNKKHQTEKYFSGDIIRIFYKYTWPGNVRELQHMVESLVALCPDNTITAEQLPPDLQRIQPDEEVVFSNTSEKTPLKQRIELYEAKIIKEALEGCDTATQAAALLGIDCGTLSRKRKRYGL